MGLEDPCEGGGPVPRRILGLLAAAFLAASLLLAFGPEAVGGGKPLEHWIREVGLGAPGDPLDKLWLQLSDLGHGRFLVYLLLLMAVLSEDRRRFFDTLRLVVIASVLCQILKVGVGRARPFDASPHSWPSGHTTSVLALALSFHHLRPPRFLAALILASLIALSRIFHMRHWPSDVCAGAALALGCAALLLGRRVRLPAVLEGEGFRSWALGAMLAYFVIDMLVYTPPPDHILLHGALLVLAASVLHAARNGGGGTHLPRGTEASGS